MRSETLSIFRILSQVDSLSLPLLFGLLGIILFLYLLGIPLSLHLDYIAAFWVAFLYSGNLWSSLFIMEIPHCGWGFISGLSRFLVREACVGVLASGTGFLLSGVL